MDGNGTERLRVLQDEIGRRVRQTVAAHPDWPCRKGCDTCCRCLAAIPDLTPPEWEDVRGGLAALPAPVQAEIRMRVKALAGAARPITCPFLDLDEGSCRIYERRPVACRTYGFYVDRDGGLFCPLVERTAPGDVIWGNQAGVDARLAAAGPASDLIACFAEETAA